MRAGLDRRTALVGFAAGLTGAVIAARDLASAWSQAGSHAGSASRWRQSMAAIGAYYINQSRTTARPERFSPAALAQEALRSLEVSEAEARTYLDGEGTPAPAARSRQDFNDGRTRVVDGWVLSVTEVAAGVLAWRDATA
jgi:hypothetical protein